MVFRLVVGVLLVIREMEELAAARDMGCVSGACKEDFTPESLLLQVEHGSSFTVQQALPKLPADQGLEAQLETGAAPNPALSPVPSVYCVDEDPSCESRKPNCSAPLVQMVCQKTCGACQNQGPEAQPEKRPAPSPTLRPVTATCVDEDPNCESSYKPYCSAPHVQKVCQKTCSVCQSSGPALDQGPEAQLEGPAPSPVPALACVDEDANCESSYKPYCSAPHIQKVCQKTCGLCTDPQVEAGPAQPVEAGQTCIDTDQNCQSSYKPYCYADHVKKACPKTCGACDAASTPESLLQRTDHVSGIHELPAPYFGKVWHHIGRHPAAFPQLQFDSPSAKELEHFQLLKDLRTNGFRCASKSFQGIPNTEATFKFDCRLWRAARQWSAEMGSQNFFSHVRGDSNPCKRTSEQGLGACSENIAASNDSPAATLEQFKKSDGHCVNMMDPGLNRFGAGYVMTPGSEWTHYWTQSMGTDSQPPDQSCLPGAGGPAPSPPAPSPVPSSSCEDEDPNCKSSYRQYCSYPHIQKACRKTCGVCRSGPAPPPMPTATCKDDDPNCASSYQPFCSASRIQKVCRKTCGVC